MIPKEAVRKEEDLTKLQCLDGTIQETDKGYMMILPSLLRCGKCNELKLNTDILFHISRCEENNSECGHETSLRVVTWGEECGIRRRRPYADRLCPPVRLCTRCCCVFFKEQKKSDVASFQMDLEKLKISFSKTFSRSRFKVHKEVSYIAGVLHDSSVFFSPTYRRTNHPQITQRFLMGMVGGGITSSKPERRKREGGLSMCRSPNSPRESQKERRDITGKIITPVFSSPSIDTLDGMVTSTSPSYSSESTTSAFEVIDFPVLESTPRSLWMWRKLKHKYIRNYRISDLVETRKEVTEVG
jgi:hypothetical protein